MAALETREESRQIPRQSFVIELYFRMERMYQNRTLVILCLPLFFLFLVFTFCKEDSFEDKNQKEAASDTIGSDSEMEKTWMAFASSVERNDLVAFKNLSTKRIHCMDCILNEKESSSKDSADLNPIAWYKSYYSDPEELSYIPIDRFLQNNHSNVFDKETKKALKDPDRFSISPRYKNQETDDGSCIFSDRKSQNREGYEVLVTVHKPLFGSEVTQKGFSFIQTKNGLKFCGTYFIP